MFKRATSKEKMLLWRHFHFQVVFLNKRILLFFKYVPTLAGPNTNLFFYIVFLKINIVFGNIKSFMHVDNDYLDCTRKQGYK